MLAVSVINRDISKLTSEKRVNVFIVDDTLYERNRSKHVELLSWVLDHTKNKFVKGFRLLTLAWSDGNSLVPISGCLLSSNNPQKILSEARPIDKLNLRL